MDRSTWAAVRTGVRLAFAHHPLCDRFHGDVWRVAGVPVCSGCAATWPVFLVAFPTALASILSGGLGARSAILLGLVLGFPHGVTYVRRWPRGFRVAAKILGGAGLGLLAAGMVLAPAPAWVRLAAVVGLLVAFGALQGVRLRSILTVCDGCTWRRDWGRCPGFQEGAPHDPPVHEACSSQIRM